MNPAFVKPLFAVVISGLLASGAVSAQQGSWNDREHRQGPPSAEAQLTRLREHLGLSDDQALRLLVVLQSARNDREELQARMMEQFGFELCSLRNRTETDILDILTPEQVAAFQQLKQNRQGEKKGPNREAPDCTAYDG
jgi:hypothetical protein